MKPLTPTQARDLGVAVLRWRSGARLVQDRTITGFAFASSTIAAFKRGGWIEVHVNDGVTRYRPTEKALAWFDGLDAPDAAQE